MSISTACPDWRDRLAAGRSLVPTMDLDTAEADRAARIFNRLRLPDVIGQPLIGDCVGDWYRDSVRALNGSYSIAANTRRIATVFMMLPKKQGKTTLSGGLMLTQLMMNRRPNARFGILGGTQKIAGESYDAAAGMIEADKKLQRFLKPTDHLKLIEHRLTGAYLEITSFDLKVATGGKFAGCLIEEVHVLGSMAKADRVIGQIRGARVALPESFCWFITTQSEEQPAGIFASELNYARDVRDGKIDDPSYLPVLYEFPTEIQEDKSRPWENPELWGRVMPSLGSAVSLDVLEEQFRAEKHKSEADVRRWASQHLNIEIGVALNAHGWAGADYWEQTAIALTLEELLERCEVVTIGGDGGGRDDLFGLCVLGREKVTGHWLSWSRCWANKIAVERRKSEESKLRDFERDGDLRILELMSDIFDEAVEIIVRCYESGLLANVGLDAAGVTAFVDKINIAVFGSAEPPDDDDSLILAVPQGYQLQMASKGVEIKLNDAAFFHAHQQIMNWMVGNAKTEMRGNAAYITKAASGVGKIDGLMALFDAAFLMARNPEAKSIIPPDFELTVWA